MDLKATYNKIARDWMNDHHGDTWWIKGTDKYLSFLSPHSSILDVGCGAGEKAEYMVKKGFSVTGIDFSKEMIKLAKELVPTAKFIVKDIKHPLRFKTLFDGVLAQAVLLHIPKNEVIDVLKNIVNPLRKGGYLFIAVKELNPGDSDEKIIKENDYGYEFERFFSFFTLKEMKKYLNNLHMTVVYEAVTSSGKTNWVQIVARK